MHDIHILRHHPNKVLESFRVVKIERMELAVEQITDEFMIYGLRGGLIDVLSKSFPDPRKECEISIRQILSALPVAESSLSLTGCAGFSRPEPIGSPNTVRMA